MRRRWNPNEDKEKRYAGVCVSDESSSKSAGSSAGSNNFRINVVDSDISNRSSGAGNSDNVNFHVPLLADVKRATDAGGRTHSIVQDMQAVKHHLMHHERILKEKPITETLDKMISGHSLWNHSCVSSLSLSPDSSVASRAATPTFVDLRSFFRQIDENSRPAEFDGAELRYQHLCNCGAPSQLRNILVGEEEPAQILCCASQRCCFYLIVKSEGREVAVCADLSPSPTCIVQPRCHCGAICRIGDDGCWACKSSACDFKQQIESAATCPQTAGTALIADDLASNLQHDQDGNDGRWQKRFALIANGRNDDGHYGQTPAEFWSAVACDVVDLDEEVKQLFIAMMTVPVCDCNQACALVVCQVSGDYFFACRPRKCKYLAFARDRPRITGIDLGQFVEIAQSPIDRFTTMGFLTRSLGYSFSNKFFELLGDGPKHEDDNNFVSDGYPHGSYSFLDEEAAAAKRRSASLWSRLREYVVGRSGSRSIQQDHHPKGEPENQPVVAAAAAADDVHNTDCRRDKFFAFISYRGKASRYAMWVSFCAKFNVFPVFVLWFAIFPVMVWLFSYIEDPCKIDGFPVWLLTPWYCKARPPGEYPWSYSQLQFRSQHQWWFFFPIGITFAFVCVLFWNPVTSSLFWPMSKYRFFCDKYCIHQSDTDIQGIQLLRLAGYLRSSEELWCFVDDIYMQRFWTVFELATFLKLRTDRPYVRFFFSSRLNATVWAFLFKAVGQLSFYWGQYIYVAVVGTGFDQQWQLWMWRWLLFLVYDQPARAAFFYFAQKYYRDLHSFKQQVKTFDVREAELANEDDREFLLAVIDELWADHDDASGVDGRDVVRPSEAAQVSEGSGSDVRNQSSDHHLPEAGNASRAAPAAAPSDQGLDRFNTTVRKLVRLHLPSSGVRSYAVLSYPVACMYASTVGFLHGNLDLWAYNIPGRYDFASWSWEFFYRWIGLRLFLIFVNRPFLVWRIGMTARLVLWIQENIFMKLTGLSYGWSLPFGFAIWTFCLNNFLKLEQFFDIVSALAIQIPIGGTPNLLLRYQINDLPLFGIGLFDPSELEKFRWRKEIPIEEKWHWVLFVFVTIPLCLFVFEKK